MTDVPTSVVWYKSNTLRALIVAGITQALTLTGVSAQIPDTEVAALTDGVLKLIETVALIWAFYARAKQPTPPVTLTKETP